MIRDIDHLLVLDTTDFMSVDFQFQPTPTADTKAARGARRTVIGARCRLKLNHHRHEVGGFRNTETT